MRRNYWALCGPLAAVILALGIIGLPLLVPGYDPVRQTVSEIGEVASPARVPFTALLCIVAALLLLFAVAIRYASIRAGHSPLAAYLTACMAVSAAGVGIFSFPHPLHNVFGMSELVGYQAPLALAIAWRADRRARALVRTSWIMFVLVWVAIALNLSTLDRHGALWLLERPFYGLVQRALFAVWFVWAAIIGFMLFRSGGEY